MRLRGRSRRRPRSLWVQLLAPLLLTAVLATVLLAALSERSATRQADDLVRQRGDAVLQGLADRLSERRHAKEVYADLLAGNVKLSDALAHRDAVTAAQVLVPRRTRLDLGLVRVFTSEGQPLLVLGEELGIDTAAIVGDALAGISGSRVVVGDRGLVVLAVAPVKAADGIVGAVLVGRVLGGAAMTDVAGDGDVLLALARQGRVVATSSATPAAELQDLLVDIPSGGEVALAGRQHLVVRSAEPGGEVVAMVPVQDVHDTAADRRRSTVLITLSLLGGLTAIGLVQARRITRVLRSTVSLAERMAHGEYDQRVPASGTRELAELSSAVNNLAEQVQARVSELEHRAGHDALTGLANRVSFAQQVQRAIARRDQLTGVLFVDLDDFKHVNDSYGHTAGDALIISIGERLQRELRQQDSVARLGGDEFAVLVAPTADPADLEGLADRILTALREPVELGGHRLQPTASIGIAFTGDDTLTAEDLLRDADAAMYLAKRSGRNRYAVFQAGMHAELLEQVELKADLARASERGQLSVHYQPVIDLVTGRTAAVEALLRWTHPRHGAVSPVRFIPIAEQSGDIIEIGAWVLRTALQQLRAWQREDPHDPPLRLNVNVSAHQLHAPGFFDSVADALRTTGVPPRDLTLELTESVFVGKGGVHALLDRLHALGVRIAIDDFGTGYSSLSYLQDLPVDSLKIDRSFVQRLRSDGNNALVESIIAMSHALGAEPVAEGIETPEQLRLLSALGCRLGQGFLLARPAPADDRPLGRAPAQRAASVPPSTQG